TAPISAPAAAQAPEAPPSQTPPDTVPPRTPDVAPRPPSVGSTRMRDLSAPREGGARPSRGRVIPRPQAVVRVAKLPTLKQRPLKEEKKAQEPVAQKPIMKLTPEMQLKGPNVKAEDLLHRVNKTDVPLPTDLEDEEGDAQKGKVRPGQVTGRDKRHQQRNERAKLRKDRLEAEVQGGRVLLPVDEDRPQRAKRLHKLKKHLAPTQPRKGKVPIEMPVTVR